MDYKKDIKNKEKILKEVFGEIPIIIETMNNPLNYRHKVQETFGYNRKKEVISSQYLENTHILDESYKGRDIQHKKANEIIKTMLAIANRFKIQPYDEDTKRGVLRHILIRVAHKTDEIMVVIVIGDKQLKGSKEIARRLIKKHKEIKTVVVNVNTKDTTMVLSDLNHNVYGPGFIFDYALDYKFKLGPNTFFQVNPKQMEVLYNKALDLSQVTKDDKCLDLFCGIGSLTLNIAKRAKTVVGVELNYKAIEDANKSLKASGLTNVKYYSNDTTKWLQRNNEKYDIVFLDPPRSGLNEELIYNLIKTNAKKIVYISCNPLTQKKDIDLFIKNGYKLEKIEGVDMFPFTNHIETCVLLSKVNTK